MLLLYTHTWGVFVAAAMVVAWLALPRPRNGAWVWGAVALAYLPWLPAC